jgi:hypothetical protein
MVLQVIFEKIVSLSVILGETIESYFYHLWWSVGGYRRDVGYILTFLSILGN